MENNHMQWGDLTIIGTSHIARESLTYIEHAFAAVKPDIACVELDANRLSALLSGTTRQPSLREIRRIGIKGYLFALIGAWAERKLGQAVGMTPGHDMLKAVELARIERIPVALIDQDITLTLAAFSNSLTWKEKARFAVDIVKAFLSRPQAAPFDLRTVPDQRVVRRLTAQVKKRYPNVYRVLVTDRNIYMAQRLGIIIARHPGKRVLAVVGAGHEEDLMRLVKRYLRKDQRQGVVAKIPLARVSTLRSSVKVHTL